MILRGLVIWVVASTVVYAFVFLFNKQERIAAVKHSWRVAVAASVGLLFAFVLSILNHFSGL